jgi:O-antigen ligase
VIDPARPAPSTSTVRGVGPDRQSFAYAGLLAFTVLLYLRPNEWLPIGTFPIVRIVALAALAAFFVEQISDGRPFSIMPREFKYLLVLGGLMILGMPTGLNPSDSSGKFIDEFLRVFLIFMLTINVVTSFRRLLQLMEVTVLCGTVLAIGTLGRYASGENLAEGFRATGLVGGIFGNPNDLALALNVLVPISMGLGMIHRDIFRRLLYWGCAGCLALASLAAFSRAGFLTLVAVGGFLLLKLGRRYPILWVLALVAGLALVMLGPGAFWTRILTVFDTSGDVGAAQSGEIRWELIKRSIEVAGFNPIRWMLGVGVGNFHIVSNFERVHHNSYLQVFNEVGLPAMIVYLAFMITAIRNSGRIAKAFEGVRGYRQLWLTAIMIEAALVAYAIGSFFASVAFLWYLYYPAAFAVCLKLLVLRSVRKAAPDEVPRRVWNLRRIQH